MWRDWPFIFSFFHFTFLTLSFAHQLPQQHVEQQEAKFGGEQVKDEEHIKEHLEGKVDPTAHMTPEQLQFHYFNMHDLDKNGKLDGIELIKAISHYHEAKCSTCT
ncbi:unnamed protein product [Meloidogyne enterolobii]|uniref:Uncharacterized protein n=1 Tax=Meloidogyne enterolobii TaxID=390850 RepID=A0ACB0Y1K2_MELEN